MNSGIYIGIYLPDGIVKEKNTYQVVQKCSCGYIEKNSSYKFCPICGQENILIDEDDITYYNDFNISEHPYLNRVRIHNGGLKKHQCFIIFPDSIKMKYEWLYCRPNIVNIGDIMDMVVEVRDKYKEEIEYIDSKYGNLEFQVISIRN